MPGTHLANAIGPNLSAHRQELPYPLPEVAGHGSVGFRRKRGCGGYAVGVSFWVCRVRGADEDLWNFMQVEVRIMASLNRRGFLKSALAASAVWAAPFNILKAGASPNSKLNIACIGVGMQGSGNAEYLAGTDNVIALCDVDEAWHKKQIANRPRLHAIKLWTDYRVMFDKIGKEIDAVLVATPELFVSPLQARAGVFPGETEANERPGQVVEDLGGFGVGLSVVCSCRL